MKVALCISGQFRDEEASFPKTARLARELNADVFVSTWRIRGTKTTGVIYEAQFGRMFGNEFSLLLPRAIMRKGFSYCFPEFESEILKNQGQVFPEDVTKYFPNAVIDIEDEMMSLNFDTPQRDNNSLRMLYKIWRCNELKRKRERAMGERYDLVIRMRPDVVPTLNRDIIKNIMSDDLARSLWTPQADAPPLHLGDTIAVTNSAVADYYASLFGKAVLYSSRPWNYIHTELYEHILQAGLVVKHLSTDQWLTENFGLRQVQNRTILIEMIRRHQYISELLEEPYCLPFLTPLADLFPEMLTPDVPPKMAALALMTQDRDLPRRFPRECFGVLALGYKNALINEAFIVCEVASLVAEVAQNGIEQCDSGEFRSRMVHVFAESLPFEIGNIFSRADFSLALVKLELPQGLKDFFEAFMLSFGIAVFAKALDDLLVISGRIEFLNAKFLHFLHRARNLQEAHAVADLMIEKFPGHWLGYDLMGHYHSAKGHVEDALSCAERALELDLNHWGLHMRVADLTKASGNLEAALVKFRSAMAICNNDLPWVRYIETLIELGRTEEARTELEFALSKFPGRDQIERLAQTLS